MIFLTWHISEYNIGMKDCWSQSKRMLMALFNAAKPVDVWYRSDIFQYLQIVQAWDSNQKKVEKLTAYPHQMTLYSTRKNFHSPRIII